jgi:hypothetical protein
VADSFRLLLMAGPVIPVPVPAPLADALTAVQVTTTAGQSSGFQLTFAVSKESVIQKVMLPTGALDPGLRVILVILLAGSATVLMDGIVTRQDLAPSNTPGGSTLTLTGEDLSVLMSLDSRNVCYPGLSTEARVAVICARYAQYGIVPAPVPPVLTDVSSPIDQIPTQSGTDLDHLRALADAAGYVFYIDPGPQIGASVAYWGPEVRVGIPQPALSVNMDAASNVESLSFGFDGLSRTQLTINLPVPDTNLEVQVPIPDISLLRPPLAARPVAALRHEPLRDVANLPSIQAALLGLSRTATGADAISGSGQLDVLRYGHVLRARQLVAVRGAGLAYDGLYYVRSVTSDIKRGEYKQSFQLSRDGLVSLTPEVPV